MGVRDTILWFLIIAGILAAIFMDSLRESLGSMVNLFTVLAIPIFFVMLAFIFFGGTKLMPAFKPALVAYLVLAVIVGFSLTLGPPVSQMITGDSVYASKTVFSQEFLNLSVFLILGIILFSMMLVKSK